MRVQSSIDWENIVRLPARQTEAFFGAVRSDAGRPGGVVSIVRPREPGHALAGVGAPVPWLRKPGIGSVGGIMTATAETIQRVLDAYRRAAEANRTTPRCRGHCVSLDPQAGDDVLIAADLHGNRLNFVKLCQAAALQANPGRHLIMQEVCHGGPMYPSGNGCMSHLLLEDVAELKLKYPARFHFILGNHELAELTDFPIAKSNRLLNLEFRGGLQEMYGDRAEEVRLACREFLRSCPLAVRLASGVFISHSVPENVERDSFDVTVLERPWEDRDLAFGGDVFRLVWGRDYREENAAAFAKLVGAEVLIHGHEPCHEGYHAPNRRQVILDCCDQSACYLILPTGGRLSHHEILQRVHKLD